MRIMVGLTPASTRARLDRGPPVRRPTEPGLLVGVLLDASAQHNGRTGREILTIGAETMGLPRARVEEMLELVSLSSDRGEAPAQGLLPGDAPATRDRPCTPR